MIRIVPASSEHVAVIAAARTDIPALLAALDEARAESDEWKSVSEATLEANKVLLKTICRADREREIAEATLAEVRALHTRDRERLAKVEALVRGTEVDEWRREAAMGTAELPYANNRYFRLVDDLRAALATFSEES